VRVWGRLGAGGVCTGWLAPWGAFVPGVTWSGVARGHPHICRRAKFERNRTISGRVIAI